MHALPTKIIANSTVVTCYFGCRDKDTYFGPQDEPHRRESPRTSDLPLPPTRYPPRQSDWYCAVPLTREKDEINESPGSVRAGQDITTVSPPTPNWQESEV